MPKNYDLNLSGFLPEISIHPKPVSICKFSMGILWKIASISEGVYAAQKEPTAPLIFLMDLGARNACPIFRTQ